MSFLWLQSLVNPGLAEYVRAYERAITSGSIDSAISWELGGYKTKDGTVIMGAPDELKEKLLQNPKYAPLVKQVISAVAALRASRDMVGLAATLQAFENRL